MTDKDQFAAAALTGILAGHHVKKGGAIVTDEALAKHAAIRAYQIAEAMMAEKIKQDNAGAAGQQH